jgi:hypothetical protein
MKVESPDIAEIWKHAIDEGRFRDALQIGLVAYLGARDRRDEAGEGEALTLVRLTVEQMIPKSEPEGCHFCGRKGGDLRLAAGPTAVICEHCVRDLHTMFTSTVKPA